MYDIKSDYKTEAKYCRLSTLPSVKRYASNEFCQWKFIVVSKEAPPEVLENLKTLLSREILRANIYPNNEDEPVYFELQPLDGNVELIKQLSLELFVFPVSILQH